VTLVLADLPMKLKVDRTNLQLIYDYSHDGIISRLLERYDIEDIDPNYTHQVTLSLAIASSELDTFKTELTNITAGNIKVLLADKG
jgi:putative IMPACT (imprinted ancient) family translation regulator